MLLPLTAWTMSPPSTHGSPSTITFNVPARSPAFCAGAPLLDMSHEQTFTHRNRKEVDDLIGHEFPGNAEPWTDDTAMLTQFVHDGLGGIDGNRKPDVLPTSQYRRIDANDLAFFVNKRPTAIS